MTDKILITGGAGFIGSAVVKELQEHGNDIYVVDDLSFGSRNNLDIFPDDHFFKVDILDKVALNECFQIIKPAKVIHLAAIHFIPYCNSHPFLASNINIQGTLNVLDATENCGNTKQLLFASTAAVYPIMSGPIAESTAASATDIYGITKVAGEQFCRDFSRRTRIDTIVCRFFNAFGENETNPHLIPDIQAQLSKGVRKISLGNLEPKRDYIHTTDLARAVRMLSELENKGYDVFNIGSGREYSVAEIVASFEESIGEKLTILQDPVRMRKSDRLHLLADIGKIQKAIPWQPQIHIPEGINRLMKSSIPADEKS